MADPVEPPNGSHYLVRLAYEAAIEERLHVTIRWMDNGGDDRQGAWSVEVEDVDEYENADLNVAASYALEGLREELARHEP